MALPLYAEKAIFVSSERGEQAEVARTGRRALLNSALRSAGGGTSDSKGENANRISLPVSEEPSMFEEVILAQEGGLKS